MVVTGIGIHGLSGLAEVRASRLGRVVRVGGPARARAAFRTALDLAFAAFSPASTEAAFLRLGTPVEVTGEGLPDEIHIQRPERIRPLLDPAAERTIRVRLELELDPPQFGRLRELAVRDPDLVDALGGARLSLTLGWVFTKDLTVASASRMAIELGGVRLDPQEHLWLPGFLASLAGRGVVRGPLELDVDAVASAERSAEPSDREALANLRQALERAPLSVGALHVVEAGEQRWLAVGPDLTPLDALGPSRVQAVALAATVFLSGAELVALEAPTALTERPRATRNWLVAQSTRPASPLEQLFLIGDGPADLALSDAVVEEGRPDARFPVPR